MYEIYCKTDADDFTKCLLAPILCKVSEKSTIDNEVHGMTYKLANKCIDDIFKRQKLELSMRVENTELDLDDDRLLYTVHLHCPEFEKFLNDKSLNETTFLEPVSAETLDKHKGNVGEILNLSIRDNKANILGQQTVSTTGSTETGPDFRKEYHQLSMHLEKNSHGH